MFTQGSWLNPPENWSADGTQLCVTTDEKPISGARLRMVLSATAATFSARKSPAISRRSCTWRRSILRCMTRPA